MHRTYIDTHPRGSGRYAYSWGCSCGRKSGPRSNEAAVQEAASKHEETGR